MSVENQQPKRNFEVDRQSKAVVRVYPLRMSRKKWNIPIFVKHKCSEDCSKKLVRVNDTLHIEPNPNYNMTTHSCSRSEHIEKGGVPLTNFNVEQPQGTSGILHNPNEIVIPDKKISIFIDFPLTYPVEAIVNFEHDNITRKELLHTISIIYKYIYTEEERTSPPILYKITQKCRYCKDIEIKTLISTPKNPKTDDTCSICLGNKSNGELPCKHIFHKDCVEEWLSSENEDSGINNSCPLCRKIVINCEQCQGRRQISEFYENVVIPLEHRGNCINRNPTFGIFGIFGYDLEDLNIDNMKYDREKKKLYLSMFSV